MLRKIIKENQKFINYNLFSYFVIVFNVLASIYAVRENILILHKELYGVWILAFGMAGILGIFNFGFTAVTIFKFDSFKANNKLAVFFSSNLYIIFIQILITTLAVLVIYKFSYFFVRTEKYTDIFGSLLLLLLPGVLFNAVSAYLEAILYYNFKYIYHKNILEMLRLGVMNVLFVVGLYWFEDIRVLAIIYSFIAVGAFSYSLKRFLSKEKIVIEKKSFNSKYMIENIHNSLSYWLLGISSIIIAQTDVFFISMMNFNMGVVTMYSQSFRLQDIALKIIKKVTEIKGPKILSLFNQGKHEAVADIYNKLLWINLILSIAAFFAIVFTGKYLLEFWLDKAIIFDQRLITVLSLICITSSIHWVLWNFCNLTGQQKRVKVVVIFEILANLVFSFIFIKIWGIIGLGIASLLSNSITIVYTYLLFLRYNKESRLA